MDNPLLPYLPASRPHPDLGANAELYGRFIGSWDVHNRHFDEQRREWVETEREVHFGWILDGRAIQDLWGSPTEGFGTTIRCYDPTIDAWRVEFLSPRYGSYCSLIGRARGDMIMQEGRQSDGRLIRWTFNDITPTTFVWRGEISDDGADFRLEQEMHCRRR